MSESAAETKSKLLESAKKEFLEKGFMGASLRTIAANAGVTTGAMYRHFKDKDDFFCALVDPAIEVTIQTVSLADSAHHLDFENPLSQEHFDVESKETNNFLNYIYDNYDIFTLLLTKASGSTHEHFQDLNKKNRQNDHSLYCFNSYKCLCRNYYPQNVQKSSLSVHSEYRRIHPLWHAPHDGYTSNCVNFV